MGNAAEKFFVPERHFPYASRFLTIDGQRLHYIDEGTGPVVFLLHGNPTWCFFYRHLIETLKSSFRVIAVDYIGCGLSDHPEYKHYRARDRVQEVEALYQELKIDRFSIVMHDWGGAIGTKFLQGHLDKVESVVYLNTTLTEVESLPPMIKASAHPLIGKFLTKTTRQFLRYLTGPGSVTKLPRHIREGYLYPYQTAAQRTAIWDFVSDIPFETSHPTYPDMLELAQGFAKMQHLPIKIVWGLRDPCFHPYMLRKVAAHFPKADILEIPDAGHLVLEDAPQTACPAIRDFITRAVKNEHVYASAHHHPRSGCNALYRSFKSLDARTLEKPGAIIPHCFGTTVRYGHISFKELSATINQYQRGLIELGLKPGDRVLMLVPPGEHFLTLSFAVMACGATPAFVDPGVGREKLFKCIKDCDPHVLIGVPKAHLLRIKGRRLFPNLKFSLWVSDTVSFGGANLSYLRRFAAAEIPAAESPEGVSFIAFTSGATGTPKGVIFTNEMIERQLEIFREVFTFTPGSKDLPLLPIFAIYSFALGVSSAFAPINPAKPLSLDPAVVVRIINDLGIQSSFGSPTLWDKISNYCVRHSELLPTIEKVLMAGAPVGPQVLERVQGILPKGTAYTPYGATEALPVTLISSQAINNLYGIRARGGEQGTPVGKPIEGVTVKIIAPAESVVRDADEVRELPSFEIGEIIVKGANVSPLYLNRVDANLQGKIRSSDEFWHRIGDVGYKDSEGNLYYCGRRSHVVVTTSRTFYPDPVENIFNAHPQVKRSALVAIKGGQGAAVAIETLPGKMPKGAEIRRAFCAELLEVGAQSEVTSSIKEFYFFESFPVDARHNAKIYRDTLASLIEQGRYA